MSVPFTLYRLFHDDGTSKSWAFRLNGDGTFTAVWGKTGNRMSIKVIEIDHPDKVTKLIRSKLRKGYQALGDIFIDDDGKLTNVAPSEPEPVEQNLPSEDPRIYWSVRFINKLPSENRDSLKELCNRLKAIFHRFGKNFDDEPIIRSTLIKNSGMIKKEDGIFVFLFLLALKRFVPLITVSLSHEDGVEISDQLKLETEALSFFDTDLESIRSISEEIGLLQKRLDLSTIAPEIEDFYF